MCYSGRSLLVEINITFPEILIMLTAWSCCFSSSFSSSIFILSLSSIGAKVCSALQQWWNLRPTQATEKWAIYYPRTVASRVEWESVVVCNSVKHVFVLILIHRPVNPDRIVIFLTFPSQHSSTWPDALFVSLRFTTSFIASFTLIVFFFVFNRFRHSLISVLIILYGSYFNTWTYLICEEELSTVYRGCISDLNIPLSLA